MDRRAINDRRRIGTVKAALSMYGERILEGSSSLEKFEKDLPEVSSRTGDLHMAKKEMVRYKEGKRAAESVKVQAESELSNAKMTVKDLAMQLEESSTKAKARIRDVDKLKKSSKGQSKALAVGCDESHKYEEVMRELENVKQELSKLKLDMATVLEEKKRAEKEIERCSSKSWSNVSSLETLRKEIEEINEEQVVVELAKIEARKEFVEIEAQREKEAGEFASAMEENKEKVKDVTEEIDRSRELEAKLAVTLSDINVLQSELKLAKDMDKKVNRTESARRLDEGNEIEVLPSALLLSITEELEAAKKELALTREEGFQFMTSMDIIRSELKHVTEETTRLAKTKEKADVTVQNLNSKLLRAKSKLEAATAVEEKTKSILSNLSDTLQQLKTEAELAKKEKELISEETANLKAEIQKTDSQIDLTEQRLQAAIEELEAVKLKEAFAIENLKKIVENTMRSRAAAGKQNSSITISKFEYEYLIGQAAAAEEIADKKVAAAQAWIEALKASEKEMAMRIENAHREIRETRVEEEKELHRTESSLSAQRRVEGELRKWRKSERNAEGQRRSMKVSGNLTPSRRAKVRKSGSPAVRVPPRVAPRSTGRKQKTPMPNLSKLFMGKKSDKDI